MRPATRCTTGWRTIGLFVCLCPTVVTAGERFEVWQRDGTRREGKSLEYLFDSQVGPQLDGQPIDTTDHPLRAIHDTSLTSAALRSFIEFANGDVLPGRIEAYLPASADGGRARFVVQIESDGSPLDLVNETVEVRESAVKRIVDGGATRGDFEPGRVRLHDGRRLAAKSIRFEPDGVRCLTDDEVVAVPFDELRELHIPRSDAIAAILDDAAWSLPGGHGTVVRVRTTGGSQLTLTRRLVQRNGGTLAVRPNWSLDTLEVAAASLVWFTVRDPDEVPLSLLPVAAVRTRAGVHQWPWRRNENVRRSDLRCRSLAADLGVGTHSHCELEFELPPGALEFSTLVGIDDIVGRGGCVTCRIHRDNVQSPPAWTSGFVIGGAEPVRVGPLDIAGAKRLVLVTEFGHDGRPADADPLDIRDHLNWLLPLVRIDSKQLPQPTLNLARWLPALEGWRVNDADRGRIQLRPVWDAPRQAWTFSSVDDGGDGSAPIEFSRTMRVDFTNSRLVVGAAHDGEGSRGFRLEVRIDGQPIAPALNGELTSRRASLQRSDERDYSLGGFLDQDVRVSIAVVREGDRNARAAGVVWRRLQVLPLIDNLPGDGKPLKPEVPLTSLAAETIRVGGRDSKLALTAGRLTDGTPLAIRGARFEQGVGIPSATEITYRLEPGWARFVAVIGLADGGQSAGPFEILLDGQAHWKDDAAKYDRTSPGRQVDVALPAGRDRITLRVGSREGFAAWASAGFLKN
jgi:hypothetical protein